MANGRIDVYFHNSSGDEGPSEEENGSSAEGQTTAPKKNKKDAARSAIESMAIGYAKKSLNYGVSIMGDLTGDYQTQKGLQNFISATSTLVMMANFPAGTIAGAFSIATQTFTTLIQTHKANKETELYAKRTGNETINNSEAD